MRQETAIGVTSLPKLTPWRRSLLADTSATCTLILVELSLLAFAMHLGLLDPHRTRIPLGDAPNYIAMAHSPFLSDPAGHHAPFTWRVLTPWLAYVLNRLGLPLASAFLLITVVGLCGASIGVYALLRVCGASFWQALAVALLVQTQYALGLETLWAPIGTDSLSYLFLALAFIFYLQDRRYCLMVTLALGTLNRETQLFAVAAFAGEQVIRRDWNRLKGYLPAYIIPIILVVVLRLTIYQVGHYSLLTQIPRTWHQRGVLAGRASTHALFGNVDSLGLNLYHLTINSFGFLLPLLLLQVIHPPYTTRRPVVWIFLLVTGVQIVFAADNERLMIVAFPVFALAAWHELRWIARQTKLPAASIGFILVLAQALFLLGQFYKLMADFSLPTNLIHEPHWLGMLWLGVLLALAVVDFGAGVWVLRRGTLMLLRQRQRVRAA